MSHSYLPVLVSLSKVLFPAVVSWRICLAVAVSVGAGGAAAQEPADTGRYVPYSGIEFGTAGVTRLILETRNSGADPMFCSAALAHWYSQALGTVGPGETLTVTLWHDPKTGSLALLNTEGARMPVEAVTCGTESDPHTARLILPFAKGPAVARIRHLCGPSGENFACTRVP